jgi:hypothetical protein
MWWTHRTSCFPRVAVQRPLKPSSPTNPGAGVQKQRAISDAMGRRGRRKKPRAWDLCVSSQLAWPHPGRLAHFSPFASQQFPMVWNATLCFPLPVFLRHGLLSRSVWPSTLLISRPSILPPCLVHSSSIRSLRDGGCPVAGRRSCFASAANDEQCGGSVPGQGRERGLETEKGARTAGGHGRVMCRRRSTAPPRSPAPFSPLFSRSPCLVSLPVETPSTPRRKRTGRSDCAVDVDGLRLFLLACGQADTWNSSSLHFVFSRAPAALARQTPRRDFVLVRRSLARVPRRRAREAGCAIFAFGLCFASVGSVRRHFPRCPWAEKRVFSSRARKDVVDLGELHPSGTRPPCRPPPSPIA